MTAQRSHSIVITDGSRSLYTFDYIPRLDRGVESPQMAWHQRMIVRYRRDGGEAVKRKAADIWKPGMAPVEFFRQMQASAGYKRYLPQTFNHTPLEDIAEPLDLAPRCTPTGRTLAFILDALRSDGRQEVKMSDVKTVVAKDGPRITKLESLSADARRHAESVLYSQILKRCSML